MLDRTTFRSALYQPLDGKHRGWRALIDLVSGRARRQGEGTSNDRAYDIVSKWNELRNEALSVQAMVLLHPKEVPLCLTTIVSKIC
jgi:hypothetical protein